MGFPYCIVLKLQDFQKHPFLDAPPFLQGQYSKYFLEYRKKSTKAKVIKGFKELGVMRFSRELITLMKYHTEAGSERR